MKKIKQLVVLRLGLVFSSIPTLSFLFTGLAEIAEARVTANVPPSRTMYQTLEKLEAFGCAYPTFRSFAPQSYFELRSAIIAEESCTAPESVLKEREQIYKPSLWPEAQATLLALGNESVSLLGMQAAVSPTFPLRENRFLFDGVGLYLEADVHTEGALGELGYAFGFTPGFIVGANDFQNPAARFYLQEAYIKAGFRRVEILYGRTSMRFGETRHGSLLLGGASAPLDLVKLTVRPHVLPSFLKYLGPLTFETWLTGPEDRTNPFYAPAFSGDRFWGVQLGVRPFSWMELGFLELFQLGGTGIPGLQFGDAASLFFFGGHPGLASKAHRALALSASFWLPAKRARIYTQFAFDRLGPISDWVGKDGSLLVGVWLPTFIPGSISWNLRLEAVQTGLGPYQSATWTQGLSSKASPLGHPLGADGTGLYLDIETPILRLGIPMQPTLSAMYETRNRSQAQALLPENRYGVGLTLMNRWGLVEASAQVAVQETANPRYQAGERTSVGTWVQAKYSAF